MRRNRSAPTLARGSLRWIACAILFVLWVGCAERERRNPFDPGNPETEGIPHVLDARAGDQMVSLGWDLGSLKGIRRTRISRRTFGGDAVGLTPNGLDPIIHSFVDSTVLNNVDYEYRMELELPSGTVQPSAWDPATPGGVIPWVADGDGGGLARLTPDGRDLIGRVQDGLSVLDIAADTLEDAFWFVDYFGGGLYQHAADGRLLRQCAVPGARAVAVDPDGSTIWVSSFSEQRLERRLRDGDLVWVDSTTVGHIDDLLATGPGEVWMVNAEGEVRLWRGGSLTVRVSGFQRPVALAPSTSGGVFVLDQDAASVRLLGSTGKEERHTDSFLVAPTDLASDGSGGVWVADPGRGELVHFDENLRETATTSQQGVRGVMWDERDRHLWVAGEMGVRLLDSSGRLISGLSLGPRPLDVEVIHLRRRT